MAPPLLAPISDPAFCPRNERRIRPPQRSRRTSLCQPGESKAASPAAGDTRVDGVALPLDLWGIGDSASVASETRDCGYIGLERHV
eukprot:scaffold681228_cov70-Prasinocladus_malaysianus.AAC.1